MNILIKEEGALIDPFCDSPKRLSITAVLALTLGLLGVHRFYLGRHTTGLLQMCTLGGLGIWLVYDLLMLANGGLVDAKGKRVCHQGKPSRESLLRIIN